MSPTNRATRQSLRAPDARSTGAAEATGVGARRAPGPAEALASTAAPFDGYPYLVTRIGRTALRHLAVVPAGWPRGRLLELAIRQATTNRLETCLCLGPADAVFVSPAGVTRDATFVPVGLPVCDRLAVAAPLPETAELAARCDALRAFVRRCTRRGHLVGDGLEGGRPATPADVARLAGPAVDGLPRGLRRCPACGDLSGERLRIEGPRVERLHGAPVGDEDRRPEVVEIHCRCDNHNRCAGCGGPLAEHRLSAWHWDEADGRAYYLAAYGGLSHRCADGSPAPERPAGRPRRRGGM